MSIAMVFVLDGCRHNGFAPMRGVLRLETHQTRATSPAAHKKDWESAF
jgi:hypothetical protein